MEFSLRSISKFFFGKSIENTAADLQRSSERLSDKFNNISRRMLPNGLRVDSRPNPDSHILNVTVSVNAGSLNDPPGKEGAAHMVEHNASRRNDALVKMVQDFRTRGGSVCAGTGASKTIYKFSIPSGYANEKLLYALAGRMVASDGFDSRQLQEEKEVVLCEAAEIADIYNQDVHHNLVTQAMGKKPIASYIGGTPDSIVGLTTDDLTAFQRKHYVARNMTVEISGAQSAFVSPYHQIKENFGHLPPGSVTPSVEVENEYKGGFRHMEDSSAKMTYASVAMPVLGQNKDGAEDILVKYLYVALLTRLRGEHDRVSYSPQVGINDSYRNQKLLVIETSAQPHKAQVLLPAVAGVLSDLAAGKVDDRFFKTAVAQRRSERMKVQDSIVEDKNNFINTISTKQYTRQVMRALDALKPEDLTALTKTILASGPPTLVTKGKVDNVQSYEDFLKMLPAVPAPSAPGVSRAATALPVA